MPTISRLRFFTPTVFTDSLKEPSSTYLSPLSNPDQAYLYWNDHIITDPTLELRKEHLVVVVLDNKLKPIGHTVVSTGSGNQTLCQVSEVLRPVILAGAYNLLLMHNHPSGNVIPSSQDYRITKQVKEAAHLFEIRLCDHLVIGTHPTNPNTFYSFGDHQEL